MAAARRKYPENIPMRRTSCVRVAIAIIVQRVRALLIFLIVDNAQAYPHRTL